MGCGQRADLPPQLAPIPDQLAYSGVPNDIPFSVSDEHLGSLLVSAASDDQEVLADSAMVPGGTGQDRILTVTPARDSQGTAGITLTAADARGQEASARFDLEVRQAFARTYPVLESEHPDSFNWLGHAVAIGGGYAIVGSPREDVDSALNAGAAYVFTKERDGWSADPQRLTAPEPVSNAGFGGSVALSGEYLLVGAPWEDLGACDVCGAAYMFRLEGEAWVPVGEKLLATEPLDGARFGQAVAISGGNALVGAPHDTLGACDRCGSVRAFVLEAGSWVPLGPSFTAQGVDLDAGFGYSVALDGEHAIVGAPYKDLIGAVYLFGLVDGAWVAVEPALESPYDVEWTEFGLSVDIDGDLVVVGAPGARGELGEVHSFRRGEGGWTEVPSRLVGSAEGGPYPGFGWSVGLGGGFLVVGAPHPGPGSTSTGSAHVYRPYREGWVELATLLPPMPVVGADGPRFGWAVAIDGEHAIVGARLSEDRFDHVDAGAAYIYGR